MSNGPFIVFEGLDGSGTTTQAELLKGWIEDIGGKRVYLTREPTGGPVGSLIQQALKKRVKLSFQTLALLFAADRLDHIEWEIKDKLSNNIPVICDRYYLSSFAYQLLEAPDDLPWLESLNAKAITPDLTILLDVPAEVCMDRIKKTRWQMELFEELDRLKAIRENYLQLARGPRSQTERIVVINGDRPLHDVQTEIQSIIRHELDFDIDV